MLVCFYDEDFEVRTEETEEPCKESIRNTLYRLQQSTCEVKLARHYLLDLNRLFMAPNSAIIEDCLTLKEASINGAQ